MNEETDSDDGFVKEIISGLRTTFKSEDFDAAEKALVAREAKLKLEITRLTSVLERRELERMKMVDDKLDQRVAGMSESEARGEARATEEWLSRKVLEEDKQSPVSEVLELRKRLRNAERYKKELNDRVAALEADVAELSTPDNKRLRNSGAGKFSHQERIEILDSDDDDDSAMIVELAKKESSPKTLEPKISYSPNATENKNSTEIGAKDSLNENTRRGPKSPVVELVTSTPEKENPVNKASSSNNGSDELNNVSDQPKPASDRVGKDTWGKRSVLTGNYQNFWDKFGEIDCLPSVSK